MAHENVQGLRAPCALGPPVPHHPGMQLCPACRLIAARARHLSITTVATTGIEC